MACGDVLGVAAALVCCCGEVRRYVVVWYKVMTWYGVVCLLYFPLLLPCSQCKQVVVLVHELGCAIGTQLCLESTIYKYMAVVQKV